MQCFLDGCVTLDNVWQATIRVHLMKTLGNLMIHEAFLLNNLNTLGNGVLNLAVQLSEFLYFV